MIEPVNISIGAAILISLIFIGTFLRVYAGFYFDYKNKEYLSNKNNEEMKPLDLSRAHKIFNYWPKWKQELSNSILKPSEPPYTKKNLHDIPENWRPLAHTIESLDTPNLIKNTIINFCINHHHFNNSTLSPIPPRFAEWLIEKSQDKEIVPIYLSRYDMSQNGKP